MDPNDRKQLRAIAERWMKVAHSTEMSERKALWRALRDLKGERPMMKFDAYFFDGYISENQLTCKDPQLRNLERLMLGMLRQYDEVGDDIVIPPMLRIPWKIDATPMGLEIIKHTPKNIEHNIGYSFDYPLSTLGDVNKLTKRTFSVDRETTLALKQKLDDAFDGILPVVVGNADMISQPYGMQFGFPIFTGCNYGGVTIELFKLLGYDTLSYWLYDEPGAIHHIMRYLTDDRIAQFRYLESEQLLDYNTDHQFCGTVCYGFCSDLPQGGDGQRVRLSDMWGWVEAQETVVLSPEMFSVFIMPYLSEIGRLFGLLHYGCCERHDDRYNHIVSALPHIRSFTTAKWNDIFKLAELMEGKHIITCKPAAENLSGAAANWPTFEKGIWDAYNATQKGKHLEIIFGDLHDINYDWGRLSEATMRVKKLLSI